MMRSSGYNRFGVLMGTSWPASCPRSHRLQGDFSPMITLILLQRAFCATAINAVLIRIHQGTGNDGVFDERLDGLLLHIGHQLDHDLTTALYHPKNGWPLFLQGPSARFAFEPPSTSLSALALHHLRLAFMTRNHIGFVALHFV